MTQQEEVLKNHAAFQERLPALLQSHPGKFALMRDQAIIEFFDTARDAYLAGACMFNDGRYSLQEVTDTVADLGWFSHCQPCVPPMRSAATP